MPEVATFTTLSLPTVLAVLAGATVAAVIAFLVRPLRRSVVVPSLVVFRHGPAIEAVQRGLARWPMKLAALMLVLAALAALSFASGGPRLAPRERSRTIIAIDASPSMAVASRREEARMAAIEAIRRLGAGDSVLVALAGPGLFPLTPWTTDHGAALLAAEHLGQVIGPDDPEAIMRDAKALLGADGGRLVLVSDMAMDIKPTDMTVEGIPVGTTAANAAISRLAARLKPGRRDLSDVAIRVSAFGGTVRGRVVIACGDREFAPAAAAEFEASPGRAHDIKLANVPLCGESLQARLLSDEDALDSDNALVLRLPAARRLEIGVVGQAGLFVTTALDVQPGVEIKRLAAMPERTKADLLVVANAPGRVPDGATVFLIRPGPENGRIQVAGTEARPVVEPPETPDPLIEGVSLSDVNIASAVVMQAGPTDTPVLVSGRGNPILMRRDTPTERTVALAFGLDASDLGLRVAWPVLVSNILAWAAQASSDFASAEATIPEAESDTTPRAVLSPFTGAAVSTLDRIAASIGDRATRFLAVLALILLMAEWAMAQRRPDAY